ncbi:type II toxin-antitoxin system HigB family toxin [uncultured Bacteroides sp.]|uniref:type II toxin-antitoxin system HigB family toxin n=1 Tax=uncultured Bacteroides sp. TaxID=162156 RepID=UPI00261A7BC7|nr:type II toxin-antitoxin system HigB family toxin [uncultured Bacteroides sp.]
MIIANTIVLQEFVQKHTRSVKAINKWLIFVRQAQWKNHNDLKKDFPSADYVGNSRYVFNISGNNYRLIAVVLFIDEVLIIRYIGTHADYDKIKDCSEL